MFVIFCSFEQDVVSINAGPKIEFDRPASPSQGIWSIAHSFVAFKVIWFPYTIWAVGLSHAIILEPPT